MVTIKRDVPAEVLAPPGRGTLFIATKRKVTFDLRGLRERVAHGGHVTEGRLGW